MKKLLSINLIVLSLVACSGAEIVREYEWGKPGDAKQLVGGRVVTVDGKTALEVANSNSAPATIRVLNIPHPAISKKVYAVVGSVKCAAVQGDGYLEMWNYFTNAAGNPAELAYFSRTLAASGPMAKLSGTSGWRTFMLPFDSNGASNSPTRLELNVVLPSQGKVYLSSIQLVESASGLNGLLSTAAPWWSERTGGLIGGMVGAGVGCFAGLLSWLASRGQSRDFVLVSLRVLTGIGAASLIAGVAALFFHQPYGVWFVLVLMGVLLVAICPFRLAQYTTQYQAVELRRMASLDTPGR